MPTSAATAQCGTHPHVIERAGADHGVAQGAAIDCCVGTDLDVVTEAKLRHRLELVSRVDSGEAEALLADPLAPGRDAGAEDRMADTDTRADPAIHCTLPTAPGPIMATRTISGVRVDHGLRADVGRGVHDAPTATTAER